MKFLNQIDSSGNTVLLRLNLNVPLRKRKIADDFRIKAVLPTIDFVAGRAAKTVICAHLGRPDGKDAKFSLAPVAKYLKKIYKKRLLFLNDCIGAEVKQAISASPAGSIILLENLRFHAGERANDETFGKQLAELADVYINDAFGDSYEAYASVIWPAKLLPSAAGLRMKREIESLDRLKQPAHPFVLLVGGVKIAEKMGTLKKLGERADQILVGGGVANTLLAASGINVQKSLFQADELSMAKEVLKQFGNKLVLPMDSCVAKFKKNGEIHKWSARLASVRELEDGEAIFDIGAETLHAYKAACDKAETVFWAGPLGYIEWHQTAKASRELLLMLSEHPNYSVIGGGESASLVSDLKLHKKMDFVSTGGGAALKYLSGDTMPGIEALR